MIKFEHILNEAFNRNLTEDMEADDKCPQCDSPAVQLLRYHCSNSDCPLYDPRVTVGGSHTASASAQSARPKFARPSGKLRPGTIHMKRGTVIDADHILEDTNAPPLVVAGIGPGQGRIYTSKYRVGRSLRMPEFYALSRTPVGHYKWDPHHTRHLIEGKFKTILTMDPRNIARIDYT